MPSPSPASKLQGEHSEQEAQEAPVPLTKAPKLLKASRILSNSTWDPGPDSEGSECLRLPLALSLLRRRRRGASAGAMGGEVGVRRSPPVGLGPSPLARKGVEMRGSYGQFVSCWSGFSPVPLLAGRLASLAPLTSPSGSLLSDLYGWSLNGLGEALLSRARDLTQDALQTVWPGSAYAKGPVGCAAFGPSFNHRFLRLSGKQQPAELMRFRAARLATMALHSLWSSRRPRSVPNSELKEVAVSRIGAHVPEESKDVDETGP